MTTPHHFLEILKKGYSLDVVYILSLVEQGLDLSEMSEGSNKFAALLDTCYRKGLLCDGEKLTLEGKALLEYIKTEDNIKLVKKKASTSDFDRFWEVFPSTDTFIYTGKKFEGSRALKTNKEDCRTKFNAILNEGEYSVEEIVRAVRYDVMQKMKNSFRTGQNKLSYLQNSLTYLRQRSFEPFIELSNTKLAKTQIEEHLEDSQEGVYEGVNI